MVNSDYNSNKIRVHTTEANLLKYNGNLPQQMSPELEM